MSPVELILQVSKDGTYKRKQSVSARDGIRVCIPTAVGPAFATARAEGTELYTTFPGDSMEVHNYPHRIQDYQTPEESFRLSAFAKKNE